jgi:hypothetical protein
MLYILAKTVAHPLASSPVLSGEEGGFVRGAKPSTNTPLR